MTLTKLTTNIVSRLALPPGDMIELVRAFKRDSSHWPDAGCEIRAGFSAEKRGPRGGMDATPFHAAFLLTGLMIDGPRKDAVRATYRAYTLPCGGDVGAEIVTDEQPLPPLALCPLTGEPNFGPALKKVLAHEGTARRVDLIRVRCDASLAEIHYDNGQVSRFSEPVSACLTRWADLDGSVIADVAMMLAHPE